MFKSTHVNDKSGILPAGPSHISLLRPDCAVQAVEQDLGSVGAWWPKEDSISHGLHDLVLSTLGQYTSTRAVSRCDRTIITLA